MSEMVDRRQQEREQGEEQGGGDPQARGTGGRRGGRGKEEGVRPMGTRSMHGDAG